MQHFSTLHTDTWVHKKSKHEIQGLAILIIIILVLDLRICPFLRFFTFYVLLCTLTCQIIVQQILLFLGEKNTYTTLLEPIRLLISEFFPPKPDFDLHK